MMIIVSVTCYIIYGMIHGLNARLPVAYYCIRLMSIRMIRKLSWPSRGRGRAAVRAEESREERGLLYELRLHHLQPLDHARVV